MNNQRQQRTLGILAVLLLAVPAVSDFRLSDPTSQVYSELALLAGEEIRIAGGATLVGDVASNGDLEHWTSDLRKRGASRRRHDMTRSLYTLSEEPPAGVSEALALKARIRRLAVPLYVGSLK